MENFTNILIVDDEPRVCELLTDDLSERGYSCTTANDGDAALTKLQEASFDVVLLDIRLPNRSGMELLREISVNYKDIVIIMITAFGDTLTAVEAMKLGASDFVLKPFDLDGLNVNIKAALEKKRRINERSSIQTMTEADLELAEINALARGIEINLDSIDDRSNVITERTINKASQLGFDKEQIQKWAALRNDEKRKNLETVKKLKQNAIAQVYMGMTKRLYHQRSAPNSTN